MRGKNSDGVELKDESFGLGYSLLIGVGVSNSNVFALEVNGSNFKSDLYGDSSFQYFKGLSWYHYSGPPGHARFSVLGYGNYQYDWQGSRHYICWGDNCDPPPSLPPERAEWGVLFGVGYEFEKHWQAGIFASGGKLGSSSSFSFVHINILLQYTWF